MLLLNFRTARFWLVINRKGFLCSVLRSIIPHQSNRTSHKKNPKESVRLFVNGMSILFIDRHFWVDVDVNDLEYEEVLDVPLPVPILWVYDC